jgi:hypothetical protein
LAVAVLQRCGHHATTILKSFLRERGRRISLRNGAMAAPEPRFGHAATAQQGRASGAGGTIRLASRRGGRYPACHLGRRMRARKAAAAIWLAAVARPPDRRSAKSIEPRGAISFLVDHVASATCREVATSAFSSARNASSARRQVRYQGAASCRRHNKVARSFLSRLFIKLEVQV